MNKIIKILLIGIILFQPLHVSANYKTRFTPSISVSETYDDNVDLENTNEKSDWITSISPGFSLDVYSQNNNLMLKYSPSIVRYKDEDDNNTVRHSGSISFNEALSKNLLFKLSDSYIKSEDPLEDTQGIIGVRDTRNTYQRNNWASSISYTFGPSNSFILGYSHSWLENDDVTLDDGKIFDPYTSIEYWFSQKHGMEINFGYTDAEFSRDDSGIPDDNYSGGTSGIKYLYRIDSHSTFTVKYDYTCRNFTGLKNEEDYMVHESSLGFDKQISKDLSYSFSGGYFIQNRDYSDDGKGAIFDFSLHKEINRGSLEISANGGWDEITLEAERKGFTKYQQLMANFNYQVTKNINTYSRMSYRQDKDSISHKSKTVRVTYGWRWLFSKYYSAILEYSCATRDDYDIDDDYNVNRVKIGIEWRQPYK